MSKRRFRVMMFIEVEAETLESAAMSSFDFVWQQRQSMPYTIKHARLQQGIYHCPITSSVTELPIEGATHE